MGVADPRLERARARSAAAARGITANRPGATSSSSSRHCAVEAVDARIVPSPATTTMAGVPVRRAAVRAATRVAAPRAGATEANLFLAGGLVVGLFALHGGQELVDRTLILYVSWFMLLGSVVLAVADQLELSPSPQPGVGRRCGGGVPPLVVLVFA